MDTPDWLPLTINTDGDWDKVLVTLYSVFKRDFIKRNCYFDQYKIAFDARKNDSPYEEGFWHLITRKNEKTGDRIPDFPRAKRLPWCKPTIENHRDPLIRCWNYLEANGRINTYIWLVEFDYLVIIQKRRDSAFLVSAFHIDGAKQKRYYQARYEKECI